MKELHCKEVLCIIFTATFPGDSKTPKVWTNIAAGNLSLLQRLLFILLYCRGSDKKLSTLLPFIKPQISYMSTYWNQLP
jgi:hypothetical protein